MKQVLKINFCSIYKIYFTKVKHYLVKNKFTLYNFLNFSIIFVKKYDLFVYIFE